MLLAVFTGIVSASGEGHADAKWSDRGADTCLMCHRDEVTAAVFSSGHGNPHLSGSPFGEGQLQCEACHGPGGAHAGRVAPGESRPPVINFTADESADVRNAPCLACHESDLPGDWHGSTHESEQVACSDCHVSHGAQDPVARAATQNEVCFGCHRRQAAEAQKPFSHPLRDGQMQCSDCHSAHGSAHESALVEETVNDTCYQCHADKRGPFLWEHAPVAEDCGSCHTPHGSSQPGMVHQRGPFLCQSCHSQSGHPSLAQTPDALPAGSSSLVLKNCMNCHSQVHGSNHPAGSRLTR